MNQNNKKAVTGGGNQTMKLARKLIISKRGLAIAEKGEESGDKALSVYKAKFDDPLSPEHIGALSALAKGASRRTRSTATSTAAPAANQLVPPA